MDLLKLISITLNTFPGIRCDEDESDGLMVTLADGETYKITLDDFDEDTDDSDDPRALRTVVMYNSPMYAYDRPEAITDHATLLDAALFTMSSNPAVYEAIRGLTTDGDHTDCEAIFNYHDSPTILKVRPA
jgi:hypothetical protein